MPRHRFSSGSGYTLAEIELEETKIWGIGSVYPRLCFQTRFWLHPEPSQQPKAKQSDGSVKEVLMLPSSWETKLGKSTYEWLSSQLVGVKGATNVPHHSPNPHYDQLESLLIQQVTIALIAYAARSRALE